MSSASNIKDRKAGPWDRRGRSGSGEVSYSQLKADCEKGVRYFWSKRPSVARPNSGFVKYHQP